MTEKSVTDFQMVKATRYQITMYTIRNNYNNNTEQQKIGRVNALHLIFEISFELEWIGFVFVSFGLVRFSFGMLR